jgi:adenine-specific DNA methylase
LSSTIIAKEKKSVANVADLVRTRPHYRRKLVPPDTQAFFFERLDKIIRSLAAFSSKVDRISKTVVYRGDCKRLSRIKTGSADLIFTSPPYVNALDYPRVHKFSLPWLGVDLSQYKRLHIDYVGQPVKPCTLWNSLKNEPVGIARIDHFIQDMAEQSVRNAALAAKYFTDMQSCMKEMYRCLKKNGRCVIVIGSSTTLGISINTPDLLIGVAVRVGFKLESRHVRTLDGTKRCLPFGHGNLKGGIHEEDVLVFKK